MFVMERNSLPTVPGTDNSHNQSGRDHRPNRCPLLGVARTRAGRRAMSPFDPKAKKRNHPEAADGAFIETMAVSGGSMERDHNGGSK